MKFIITLLIFCVSLNHYAQFDQIKDAISSSNEAVNFTENQAVKAIKEALENGVAKEVEQLTLADGFLKNDLVRIGFPENIKKVERKIRAVGLGSVVDKAVVSLNRTAEEATKEAIPIFTKAITDISVEDGISIVKGNKDAATQYLQQKTYQQLYNQMSPIVSEKFKKVKADVVWEQLISKYNSLPFSKEVNPNLIDYVTNEALDGIFKSIAKEELEIRDQLTARTSDLLRNVFGND